MKRRYAFGFILISTLTVSAQFAVPAMRFDKHGPRTPHTRPIAPQENRGNAFYTESFDTDLNGWEVVTPTGQVDWKWTNVGPGPTTSTYPVPALNTSTPSGWAIIDDDYDGVNGQNTNASLISPVIDLSTAGTQYLKVEFDQYFQEFQLDTTFVGVSTDGGLTWSEVLINEEVGRDGRPNPELVDVDISSFVAENPSNVRIRFRYVSTWDYGWQVDNIAIRELPANDMAILRASSTAFDYENTGFAFMDYSIYPQSEVTSMTPSATLKNKGYLDQTGVQLVVDVQGPNGSEQSTQSTAAVYSPSTETVETADAFTPSGALGDYSVTFTVAQNETDELPSNNTLVNTFKVSDFIYAHDDGATQSAITQGIDAENQPFEVGHHFSLINDGLLTAVQVAVHANTPVGTSVHGVIYSPSTTSGEHPGLIEFTDEYTVTTADLNESGDANFITMAFETPIQLLAGQTYLIMAGTFEGDAGLEYAYSGSSEAQISIIHYPDLLTDFEFYLTRTPMVRILINGGVGITENVTNISNLSNQPNPFTSSTTITFGVEMSAPVSILVHDATGRIIHTETLGKLPAGQHRYVFSAEGLAAGVYTYTIQAGANNATRRMLVSR